MNSDELLIEEYKQASENLRFGWNYIFGFFKSFILIQIILFGALVGFVGYGDNSNVENIKTATAIEKLAKKQMVSKNQAGNISAGYSVVFYILCGIGFIFSLGAVIHTKKLFAITTEFVGRIDAIEKRLWVSVDGENTGLLTSSTGEDHLSHHVYMNQRQDKVSSRVFNMENTLTVLYVSFAILWVSVFVFLICQ